MKFGWLRVMQVRLDAKSASNLVSMLSPERMPSPTNRSLVWGIFYNMIRDAKLSAADFLKTLHTVVSTETPTKAPTTTCG